MTLLRFQIISIIIVGFLMAMGALTQVSASVSDTTVALVSGSANVDYTVTDSTVADSSNLDSVVADSAVTDSAVTTDVTSGSQTAAASDAASSSFEDQSEIDSLSERITIPPLQEVVSFSKLFSSALVLLVVWFLTRFVTTVLTNFSERFSSYRLAIKRLVPIAKVSIWAVSLYFIIAGILQPPLETIITVSASVGIAVGFASQDILRNIFGGIMIILDRPFQVGDKIEIDRQYGEVLQIGLRSVRIVTEDDSVVTVPNAEIMNKAVSNANSSALDCQVVAELFLPRDSDSELVSRICRRSAQTSRYVYLQKPVFVHFTHVTVGPRDFMKVRLKAYVLDIRFEQELRSDMTTRAIAELRKHGVLTA